MASTIVVDKIKSTSGDTFTLPTSDGADGQLIKTNGSGVLSFATDVDTGIASLAADTSPQLGGDLDCNASQIQWSKGADVVSATALAVLTDGNYFDVTGTVTIATINTTGGIGTQIKLHFDGILTLTNSADIILPGGANITTAAGDEAEFVEYASGDYRCTNYTKASGGAVKILDESIDSDAYVDLSIDTAHIGNDQVTYAKIQNVADDERILGRVSGADGVIEELTKAQVLTFANVEDGATADQSASEIKTLLEDGIDSVHYVDGSIDNAHIADDAIDSEHYADGSIDNAHIADDAINSEHYADGSIDLAHLSADCVDGTKLADNAVDSEHYTDGSIDSAHLATGIVLTDIVLKDYGETTNALGSAGGSRTIDLTLGNSITATITTGTVTWTFSNPTATDEGCGFTLVQTNGGSQTVTWPASVDWAGGTAPTLTASGVDILVFWTVDGGTIWHGFAASLASG